MTAAAPTGKVNYSDLADFRKALTRLTLNENAAIRLEANGTHVSWRPITKELLHFSREIGMPIVQVNGQRVCGPPYGFAGQEPTRGCEVFLGALPRDANEKEIIPFLLKAGRIYRLRLMMDFSGTNRGFCFVQYYTPIEASRAIRILPNCEIRPGKKVGVFRSMDNMRLHIGRIPKQLTAEDVYKELRAVTEGVVRVILFVKSRSSNHRNYSTNAAIIHFESHRAASMARCFLLRGVFRMMGSRIKVDWAKPEGKMM